MTRSYFAEDVSELDDLQKRQPSKDGVRVVVLTSGPDIGFED